MAHQRDDQRNDEGPNSHLGREQLDAQARESECYSQDASIPNRVLQVAISYQDALYSPPFWDRGVLSHKTRMNIRLLSE